MQTISEARLGRSTATLRVLTYNVHSCRGMDRRHDPSRIAEVIAGCAPDIIALQELDVGRLRSGRIDQAETIAEHLRMRSHFHPALHVEEERYGDAILTALPSRLIKAGPLPSVGEPRGAIWIEVDAGGQAVQIVNTHLGLWRGERTAQASALIGPDWTGSERCRTTPTLLAGDFNAVPRSPAYKILLKQLTPADGGRARRTFPSRYPLLALDHLFVNRLATVSSLEVIGTPLARRASDHLPLLATVQFETAAQSLRGTIDVSRADFLAAHGQ